MPYTGDSIRRNINKQLHSQKGLKNWKEWTLSKQTDGNHTIKQRPGQYTAKKTQDRCELQTQTALWDAEWRTGAWRAIEINFEGSFSRFD